MNDNEKRAHDIALMLITRTVNNISGAEFADELQAIRSSAVQKQSGSNVHSATIVDQYEHLYKEILQLIN